MSIKKLNTFFENSANFIKSNIFYVNKLLDSLTLFGRLSYIVKSTKFIILF